MFLDIIFPRFNFIVDVTLLVCSFCCGAAFFVGPALWPFCRLGCNASTLLLDFVFLHPVSSSPLCGCPFCTVLSLTGRCVLLYSAFRFYVRLVLERSVNVSHQFFIHLFQLGHFFVILFQRQQGSVPFWFCYLNLAYRWVPPQGWSLPVGSPFWDELFAAFIMIFRSMGLGLSSTFLQIHWASTQLVWSLRSVCNIDCT